MKSLLAGLVTLAAFASFGVQAKAVTDTDAQVEEVTAAPQYERVQSISALGGFHSFKPVDRETLVVWTSPFRPYLIKLRIPSPDLRFAHAIAIDSRTSRVYERIRGFRYPIDQIYKLTRDEARAL
jgi:hypothetical protein